MSSADHGQASPPTKEQEKDLITLVAPNGAPWATRYHANQTVSHVLAAAVREFAKEGLVDAALAYVLVYDKTPLESGLTLGEAGVPAGATLKVRANTIPSDG